VKNKILCVFGNWLLFMACMYTAWQMIAPVTGWQVVGQQLAGIGLFWVCWFVTGFTIGFVAKLRGPRR
jgi:hypothetical protein